MQNSSLGSSTRHLSEKRETLFSGVRSYPRLPKRTCFKDRFMSLLLMSKERLSDQTDFLYHT